MGFDLIYFATENIGTEGVLLSGKYKIKLSLEDKYISIYKNDKYVKGFWGKNVEDCFAIVGENGAGKTKLVNEIMDLLQEVSQNKQKSYDYILIFEVGNELQMVSSGKYNNIELLNKEEDEEDEEDKDIKCTRCKAENSILNKIAIAYFHNALNRRDYFSKSRCKYDFSIGNQLSRFRETTYDMHYNTDLSKDTVKNYYDNQDFRVIKFLFEYALQTKDNIDFRFPNNIYISPNPFAIQEFIKEETNKSKKYNEQMIQSFIKDVKKISEHYGNNWKTHVIQSLIYIIFKELCLTSTVPEKEHLSYGTFLKECEFLGEENISQSMTSYECLDKIIKVLKEKNESYVKNVDDFLQWMKENDKKLDEFQLLYNPVDMNIKVPVSKKNEEFIYSLINVYKKQLLSYPFLEFKFDVSTGEYYFLTIFTNLYSMIKPKRDYSCNPYDDSPIDSDRDSDIDSLILIFDEIDISLHPKWQRMIMKWLVDFSENLFKGKMVKIIVTTHSPILLSDFPSNSVLYLKNKQGKVDAMIREDTKTFGCNIHLLFLNSFFLSKDGTMGANAEEKINHLAEILYRNGYHDEDPIKLRKEIEYVGNEIIRQKLNAMLERKNTSQTVAVRESDKGIFQDTLKQLKEQKKMIEEMIHLIEVRTNDKNFY